MVRKKKYKLDFKVLFNLIGKSKKVQDLKEIIYLEKYSFREYLKMKLNSL